MCLELWEFSCLYRQVCLLFRSLYRIFLFAFLRAYIKVKKKHGVGTNVCTKDKLAILSELGPAG